MSENSPEDWRQVSKGQRAVTHTDKHRVTPVRNQFQELSEHQEDSLAPRKLIVEFTGLQTEEGIPPTDPSDCRSSNDDDNTEEEIPPTDPSDSSSSNDGDNSNDNNNSNGNDNTEDDNTDTGSIGSTESFDTMTDITSDYASLLETIKLVSAEQATVFSGKKKNYADIVKFREVLGSSALATQPCSTHDGGYSWLVDTEEDYTHRTGATAPYTVQSMPKRPLRPTEPPESASSEAYKRYTINQQKYNKYLHWNNEALAALEHRFPQSLTPKTNKFEAFPMSYKIREAVDYLESPVNTDVEKRETYCAIVGDIIRRKYQPNLEGPIKYFAAMQRNEHSIDVLKQNELTYDTLIIHSQEAFRHSRIPMKAMRTINEAW
jgi:hypothetical protein